MSGTARISKEERRREIVEAAMREFASGGLYGTPVEAIAKRVGVSQPYLFQLFGTKKELFIAASAARLRAHRGVSSRRRRPRPAPTPAQGRCSCPWASRTQTCSEDREMLLMQMQAYAACERPEVARGGAGGVPAPGALRAVGLGRATDDVHPTGSREGMLMNVAAAMDLEVEVDWADWARVAVPHKGLALNHTPWRRGAVV